MSVTLELLLHSPLFIDKLRALIPRDTVIPNATELKSVLKKVLKGTKVSPDYLKQTLSKDNILNYSRNDPKGYSLDHKKLKELSREKLKDQQYPLLYYSHFMNDLRDLMDDGKKIPTMKKLMEVFNSLTLPPKWKPEAIKRKLSDKGILEYSRNAPKGYYINTEKLDSLVKKYNQIVTLDLDNTILSSLKNDSQNKIISPTPPDSPSTPPPNSQNNKSSESKPPKDSTEITKPKDDKVEASDILDTIQSFPSYLLDRMSKTARVIMGIGILEISKMSLKDLEKYSAALANARMFYDGQFNNERAIIDHIDNKTRFMNERMDKLHYQENERIIQTEIIPRIKKGKYDKYIKQLGKSKEYKDVASDISKKLGKIKKKTSLNDFALRKRITKILKELYPQPE